VRVTGWGTLLILALAASAPAPAASRDAAFRRAPTKVQAPAPDSETRRREALENIRITDVKTRCLYSGTCRFVSFDVLVANRSREIVDRLSFGWRFPESPNEGCAPATKHTERVMLKPGDNASFHIEASDGPATGMAARFCIKITGLRIAEPAAITEP